MEGATQSQRSIEKQYVRGFPFPKIGKFSREHIESALAYEPQEGDIFVVTYPKTGTTWVQYIIYNILHGIETPLPTLEEIGRIMPYMELEGAEAAKSLNPPRVIKYHVPYYLLPKNPLCKYISVFRNPYDVVVSYFYFLRNVTSVDLEFDEFFDGFLSGDMVYGRFFDHLHSWYEQRNEPNVLLLSYEKMSLNPKKGLLKIARFLGEEYFNRLSKDEVLVTKILERTSFKFMKKQLSAADKEEGESPVDKKMGAFPEKFFRKGKTGDYKNHLTEEQVERMKMWVAENTAGTEIEKFWEV